MKNQIAATSTTTKSRLPQGFDWGLPNAAALLLPPVAGLTGHLTGRYNAGFEGMLCSAQWDDGTTSHGLREGIDFAWTGKRA